MMVDIRPHSIPAAVMPQYLDEIGQNIVTLFCSAPWIAPINAAHSAASLCLNIHTLNVNSGWWHDVRTGERLKRNFAELICLCISELSEGWCGRGMADDKLPHRSMLEVELADCLVRIFDLCGGYMIDLPGALANMTREDRAVLAFHRDFPGQMMSTVAFLSDAMEVNRKSSALDVSRLSKAMAMAVLQIIGISLQQGLAVASALDEKVRFNQTRQDHSAEARRAVGGKDY